MKPRYAWKLCAWICCLSLLTTSCATIVHGGRQEIPITSEPEGATATIHPGDHRITTPGEVILSRKKPMYTVRFEKEGYQTEERYINQSFGPLTLANLLLPGWIIWIGVDCVSGAAWNLEPLQVKAYLNKE
jgi:hypothetical protein